MNKAIKLFTIAGTIAIMASSCNGDKDNKTVVATDSTGLAVSTENGKLPAPSMPKPAWGQKMDDQQAVVLEKLASYNAPPIISLTATEARKQPSPATAVMDLMKENNIPMPPDNTDTVGQDIPVQGGSIHARIYTPKTGKSSYPVIVYYHGGGWVIADLDTYGSSASALANKADAIVVSVHYRQAPEFKFPTAHMDSYAAYEWAVKNAASWKGDPKKVAVAGESAGGNLAANVSIMARDKGFQMPLCQVLVYPVAGSDMTTPSYMESDSTKPLNKAMVQWFVDKYFRSPADGKDPRINLVAANLKGLPPTLIIAAEYDPLRSEGKTLADKLNAAGVKADYKLYEGVSHEFFGMGAVVPDALAAEDEAASAFKSAFK